MNGRLALLIVLISTTGCYSSVSFVGDAGTDATVDTTTEPGHDTWADPDTAVDTIPDTHADPPRDTWTDVPPPPDCPPPPPDGSWMSWTVDDDYPYEEVEIDLPCTVEEVMYEEDGSTVIILTCGTGGMMEVHHVQIASNPVTWPALWPGQEVQLRFVADPIWWINRWMTIRGLGGELLLAAVDADAITPYGTSTSEWYGELGVEVVGGVCEPYDDYCGIHERQALFVSYHDSGELVYDGYSAWLGWFDTVFVFVGTAGAYHEIWCEDMTDAWYSAIFAVQLEG